MMIPDTIVGSAIGATAVAFVGVLGVVGARWRSHRNGRNGRNGNGKTKRGMCPLPLQEAHAAQIAGLTVSMKALEKALETAVKDIKQDMREVRDLVVSRLPKP